MTTDHLRFRNVQQKTGPYVRAWVKLLWCGHLVCTPMVSDSSSEPEHTPVADRQADNSCRRRRDRSGVPSTRGPRG